MIHIRRTQSKNTCARSIPAICRNITWSWSCQVRIRAVQLGDEICGAGHIANGVICKQWCERKCGQSSYKNGSVSSQSNTCIGQRTPDKSYCCNYILLRTFGRVYTYFTQCLEWLYGNGYIAINANLLHSICPQTTSKNMACHRAIAEKQWQNLWSSLLICIVQSPHANCNESKHVILLAEMPCFNV